MIESELHLCCAISRANLGGGDRPTKDQRERAAICVVIEWIDLTGDSFFPFTIDLIEQWRLGLRKSKEMQMKVEIALSHGTECYFKHRGKGPCSEEVEAGHVLQRCNGGPLTVENGQIECRAHNNQRREMSIEDYMKSSLMTIDTSKEANDGR